MQAIQEDQSVAASPRDAGRQALALAQVKAALARARPACTVYACSYSHHVLQIYAGLYALYQAGHIRLKQRFGPEPLRRRLAGGPIDDKVLSRETNGLLVDVEGAGLVFFDMRDGANYYRDVADRVLLYAKRSFRGPACAAHAEKCVPLGLYYPVYSERTSWHELVRSVAQLDGSRAAARNLLYSLARMVPSVGEALGVPTCASFRPAVDPDPSPRAIFLARAWPPQETSDELARHLNDRRAECIRQLRRRFGPRFLGGFARNAYALKHYADCVVDPGLSTLRRDYLRCLRGYAIGIATTGLHESIGAKFAEYIALSKAIVSEPLTYQLPGACTAGANFLEFATPEACADRVAELFDDAALRHGMMRRNAAYYLEYGTPDAVVGRALHAALAERAAQGAPRTASRSAHGGHGTAERSAV